MWEIALQICQIWMKPQTLLLCDCLKQKLQELMNLSLHALHQQWLKPSKPPIQITTILTFDMVFLLT